MALADLAQSTASPLDVTTDDTGPALLAALLSEVKTAAKLVDLAPPVFVTHGEELGLRSLLPPPEWQRVPGTLDPAATGPTATVAGVLCRQGAPAAVPAAWGPWTQLDAAGREVEGPRQDGRSHRRKAMQQNIRWSDGDPHEALRRLHPDRAEAAAAHAAAQVVVHSVQYRGEPKAPHRNTAMQRAASQRSDPKLMVFDSRAPNPAWVASRILSEHARAVHEKESKSKNKSKSKPSGSCTA